MTYKQLAETFNMLASKKPDGFAMDYANHDEWGIDLQGFDLRDRIALLNYGFRSEMVHIL